LHPPLEEFLSLAKLIRGFVPIGDIGVSRYEAALGHGLAVDFQHGAIRQDMLGLIGQLPSGGIQSGRDGARAIVTEIAAFRPVPQVLDE
jgi:hypothetical protein